MTPQEFQSAFNPIGQRWKKAYNADQVELVFEAVKDFTFEQLKTVCKKLLGSSRYAPMVPEFDRTFQELRFYPVYPAKAEEIRRRVAKQEEDYLYRVRDNIWATNNHIFVRGEKPSFIIIEDEQENEVVREALSVKSSRVAEIKNHIWNNTYSSFMGSEGKTVEPLRKVNLNDFFRDPA